MSRSYTQAPAATETTRSPSNITRLRHPEISDGARIWALARDSRVLDVNSAYSYLLWCRDFWATSIVAETAGELAGFVTGFVRPEAPGTLFIWQVAVAETQRGKGIGVAMLDGLLTRAPAGVRRLETTVSPDNTASRAMFTALARRRGMSLNKQALFTTDDFPAAHEAEELYVLEPLSRKGRPES